MSSESDTDRDDERAGQELTAGRRSSLNRRETRNRPPLYFLGGLFAAMFLGLGMPPAEHRVIPWFALLPLFLSLQRHNSSWVFRLAHGFCFAAALSTWFLYPIFRTSYMDAGAASPLWSAIQTGAPSWLVLLSCWTLFSLCAGTILRSKNVFVVWFGLPALWTGLEYLRVESLSISVPQILLGSAIDPSRAEAQVASLVGLLGLSYLVAFVNTSWLVAMRPSTWKRQISFVLVGAIVVLASLSLGLSRQLEDHPKSNEESIRLGLIQLPHDPSADGSGNKRLSLLSDALRRSEPHLLFASHGSVRGSTTEVRSKLITLAKQIQGSDEGDEGIVVAGALDSETDNRSVLVVRSSDTEPETFSSRQRLLLSDGSDGPDIQPESTTLVGESRVGIVAGADGLAPSAIRRMAQEGARLILWCADDRRAWSRELAEVHDRLAAFRAIETGLWIVRLNTGGISAVRRSDGQNVLRGPVGAEWAAIESVELQEASTFFLTAGWMVAPLCGLFALATVILMIVQFFREPKRENAP